MNFGEAFKISFLDELSEIKNSWYLKIMLSVVPMMLFVMLGSTVKKGVVQDMSIVMVDQDKSKLSRLISRTLNDTPAFNIDYKLDSMGEAKHLLDSSKAYAIVYIPENFEKDVKLGVRPKISSFVNSQYILLGKNIASALTQGVLNSSALVSFLNNLSKSTRTELSVSFAQPVIMKISPLYNSEKNYFIFLFSALLPSLWQVLVVLVIAISFGRMFKYKKLLKFKASSKLSLNGAILGKSFIYLVSYFFILLSSIMYLYGSAGFYMAGSIFDLAFTQLITTISYVVVGLFIIATGFDYARALSLSAVYTAPAFAFLGVTFPTSSMTTLATIWSNALPVSHYMQTQIAIVNYGVGLYEVREQILAIMAFWLLYLLVYIRFKKELSL